MIRIINIFTALILLAMQNQSIPQENISNGILQAKIYLPDIKQGYYQGTRFDWAGNMPSLKFSGHEYFGQWYDLYRPDIHDVVMGPVDAIQPIDFDGAKPGGKGLIVGIGTIRKPDDKPYTFTHTYEVIDHGKWKIRHKSDRILFEHILKDSDYSYEYEKVIRFEKDKPVMVIEHRLKNKGKNTLETTSYNHNFFVIDSQPVGPAYTAEFSFPLKGKFTDGGDIASMAGNKMVLGRTLVKPETVFSGNIQGEGVTGMPYVIKVENSSARTGVKITCDKPLAFVNFWCCHTTFCPEPYIRVKAEPGKTFEWTITYEFYELK
ncbi:MAG TPA: hypothetical protein VMT63_03110 [Bacteroidales bacterium]|nr:hypothetical protein [Bacteroidales bacterium]